MAELGVNVNPDGTDTVTMSGHTFEQFMSALSLLMASLDAHAGELLETLPKIDRDCVACCLQNWIDAMQFMALELGMSPDELPKA